MAVEAAFDASGSVILATTVTLNGAPAGDVVGVDLRDEALGLSMAADLAAAKTVPFEAMGRSRRRPRFGVSIGVRSGRRSREPDIEPPPADHDGVSGALGVDLGALLDRKSGFDVSLAVWSLPAADFESQDPEHWTIAVRREGENGRTSETLMPAPQPPGEPTRACPAPSEDIDAAQEERALEMTITILETQGTVTVQRPGGRRWRRAKEDKEYSTSFEPGDDPDDRGWRIQTGLDSRAVVCVRGIDEEGRPFEFDFFVTSTSQITFTASAIPRWAYLYGEERRIERERARALAERLRYRPARINTTRDVRRTDMGVSTPNCTSGVAG